MGRRTGALSHASHETCAHLLTAIKGGARAFSTTFRNSTAHASHRLPSSRVLLNQLPIFTSAFSLTYLKMMDTNNTQHSFSDVEAEINSVIAERGVTKASEYRKVIKPLLEKRRRARINHCLTELKTLLVETYKSDISEPSKLEKADILELTVRHLRDLRRQQRVLITTRRNDADADYRAGFTECANEVAACVGSMPGLDAGVRARLFAHLSKRVGQTELSTPTTQTDLVHVPAVHPSSLTPPPSPRNCSTPSCDIDSTPEHTYIPHHTMTPPHRPDYTLPTGYVSLAVLMSHKEAHQPSRSPVWRPW